MLYPLLDHDDFNKARKAVVTTAILVLIITSTVVEGDKLELAGLSLKFDKAHILLVADMVLIYFTWVFAWRAVELFTDRSYEKSVKVMEDLLVPEEKRSSMTEDAVLHAAWLKKVSRRRAVVQQIVLQGVDVIPALVLALAALSRSANWTEIGAALLS